MLVFTSLLPSPVRPVYGIFVASLVKAMTAAVDLRVVQPVIAHRCPNELRVTRRRRLDFLGVPVEAPLCFNVPHFLKGTDANLMALFSRPAFRRASVDTRLVHAHFAYPEGAAAYRLATALGLPLVLTVHGSDINVLARLPDRRLHIQAVLQRASAVVAVAKDLVSKVVALGVPQTRVHHIPNGVDLEKFSPGNKYEARSQLGLPHDRPIVLGVGSLVPVKAYDRLIRALLLLGQRTSLVLVGEGPERARLTRLIQEKSLADRVKLIGAVPHGKLRAYYRAADVLAISSHSEGWPTVIHEALACATPVVANPAGGIAEALAAPGLGCLAEGNSPTQLAEAIARALSISWDAQVLLRAASAHSWHEIAQRYLTLFEQILNVRETARSMPSSTGLRYRPNALPH